jgi:hypothetical protein
MGKTPVPRAVFANLTETVTRSPGACGQRHGPAIAPRWRPSRRWTPVGAVVAAEMVVVAARRGYPGLAAAGLAQREVAA